MQPRNGRDWKLACQNPVETSIRLTKKQKKEKRLKSFETKEKKPLKTNHQHVYKVPASVLLFIGWPVVCAGGCCCCCCCSAASDRYPTRSSSASSFSSSLLPSSSHLTSHPTYPTDIHPTSLVFFSLVHVSSSSSLSRLFVCWLSLLFTASHA